MPQGETLRVKGYREFVRATNRAEKASKREVRGTFREVGDIVKREATALFSTVDRRSAAGYRTRVRQQGVSVEQSLRKVNNKHPEYAKLQMRRALLPALRDKEGEVEHAMEKALDKVADTFDK